MVISKILSCNYKKYELELLCYNWHNIWGSKGSEWFWKNLADKKDKPELEDIFNKYAND